MFHTIEEALDDLKAGKLIIVVDDEDRENEGDLVGISDLVTPDMINFMAKEGRGLICVPIEAELADELKLTPMVDNSSDPRGTAFTVSVDHKETSTGISAFERALTIEKMVAPGAKAKDFTRPGHIFPLIAHKGGVLSRNGHTEAAVDLAKLAGYSPSGIICEILKDDGTMARVDDLKVMSQKFGMKLVTIKGLIEYRQKREEAKETVI
ncbi:3,4-dihydroxy-2-butanone-4-phosphate synthase [Niallia circulans]|uniref:3,4-dihydroxy-2-butanone 4-phosphate synthase n=1 Tax=Niallia circulans TaxID=1397 RepID=A0A553SLJ2_NIACI|nr:3,4-dihydroxy-2-butanone-4-phosphate synthase [Niallia circulans]